MCSQPSFTNAVQTKTESKQAGVKPKSSGLGGGLLPRNALRNIQISRHVVGQTYVEDTHFTLFQYQTCPFCCKVRAFLDYYGIPYNVIEVNPVFRQQLKFSNYRKVPILIVDKRGEEHLLQLNDSSLIISVLTSYFLYTNGSKDIISILKSFPSPKQTSQEIDRYLIMTLNKPDSKKLKEMLEERKWREWADNVLVHTLSPNIYRTLPESFQSFRYFAKVGYWDEYFGALQKLVSVNLGAFAMLFIGRKLKKKYKLKDDVRESLYDACRVWLNAIGSERVFMGGEKANLADLAVFGLLQSIEGCQAFEDAVKNTKIDSWFYTMKESCKNSSGHEHLADCFKRNHTY
ncbi:prostaglandin E synthase 2-like protein, partial [Dinothrombium tinctorium]